MQIIVCLPLAVKAGINPIAFLSLAWVSLRRDAWVISTNGEQWTRNQNVTLNAKNKQRIPSAVSLSPFNGERARVRGILSVPWFCIFHSPFLPWLGLVLLSTLLGCAHFESKPLSPAATAAALENRSLTNAALQTFLEKNLGPDLTNWPPAHWDFEMLSVAAFYYQPSLEVARAQWAVSRGAERTAAQHPNPQLTVTPGYDTTTATPSPWFPLAFVDVPIETAGKRGYRRAQAAHLSEAARLKVAETAWSVRSALRLSLLDFDLLDRRQTFLRRQISFQEQILRLLEQQAQAGAIAPAELLPVRIALIKLRLDLADAERALAEARARVSENLAVPFQALEQIQISFESLERFDISIDPDSPEVRRAALQSRADILRALAEYAASQSALQLEIAKQYPDVHLQPGYQYDQGDNKWTLGLVVDLPVRNQNQGPIAEAQARRRESAARFEEVQAKVLAELERATQVLRITERTAGSLRNLAAAQAQRRDSVEAQYRAGAVDQLELLNAQSELVAAQLAELDGRFKFHQAVAALEDVVQRPLDLPKTIFESSRADTRSNP